MDDPELRSDETILVRTQGIHVKSISFEGILTNRRIILIDRAKNLLPPKEIPLATIQEAEPGENAIREQTLVLSVTGKTGDVRQMILTFSRVGGAGRNKERDEWVRYIRQHILLSAKEPSPRAAPVFYEEPPVRESPAPVRIPVQAVPQPAAPAAPDIVFGTFCTKCGNKVPEGSGFCNRCGARIVTVPEEAPAPAAPAAPPETAAPVGRKERPIDRDILTIEPLIERSEESAPRDPLRSVTPTPSPTQPAPAAAPAPAMPETVQPPVMPSRTAAAQPQGRAATAAKPRAAGRRFIPRLFSPKELPPTPLVPESMPTAPSMPPSPRKPRNNRMIVMIVAVVLVIAIAAVAVMFVLPKLGSGTTPGTDAGVPAATPTATAKPSAVTTTSGTVVVATPTPVTVPATGVVVYVNYIGGWKGIYGPTDSQQKATNSGERIYTLENVNGNVDASFWKLDGSNHEIVVKIYKDGKELTSGVTSARYGKVTLSVDTATGVAKTPVIGGDTGTTATSAAAVTTTAASK